MKTGKYLTHSVLQSFSEDKYKVLVQPIYKEATCYHTLSDYPKLIGFLVDYRTLKRNKINTNEIKKDFMIFLDKNRRTNS